MLLKIRVHKVQNYISKTNRQNHLTRLNVNLYIVKSNSWNRAKMFLNMGKMYKNFEFLIQKY